MTVFIWGRALTLNLRNGFGFDIEACDSRPIWITSTEFEETKVACFDGIVLLTPFLILTFGMIYEAD